MQADWRRAGGNEGGEDAGTLETTVAAEETRESLLMVPLSTSLTLIDRNV
jgi:hypothetical protein